MKEGEISEPIPVDSHFFCQIIKVVALKKGGVIPFTQAQMLIRQKLRHKKVVTALNLMRKRLRQRAFIWPPNLFTKEN